MRGSSGRHWQPSCPGKLSGGAEVRAMLGGTPRTQRGRGLHFSASPFMLAIELQGCGAGSHYCLQQLVPSLSHLGAIVVPEAHRLLRCSRSKDAVPLGTCKSRGGVDRGQMSFLSKSVSVG